MKRAAIILFVFLALAAQATAQFNFGSVQSTQEVTLEPGESVEMKLHFFNIHGATETRIDLEVLDIPQGWQVRTRPKKLTVPMSDPVKVIPDKVPKGIEYVGSPLGYLQTKVVLVTIRAPKDATPGTTQISVRGIATWPNQDGLIAFNQPRNFNIDAHIKEPVYLIEKISTAGLDSPLKPSVTGQAVKDSQNDKFTILDYISGWLRSLAAFFTAILGR